MARCYAPPRGYAAHLPFLFLNHKWVRNHHQLAKHLDHKSMSFAGYMQSPEDANGIHIKALRNENGAYMESSRG